MNQRILFFVILIISASLISGCVRPSKEVSKLTIHLPKTKVSTLGLAATGILGHVVLNIRGEGIQTPISLNYDAKTEGDSAPVGLSGNITVEVPSGKARLIQVMAIYVDTTTKQGEFYYGDQQADLVGGEQSVNIPATSVGLGSIDGGKVVGRYYRGDGTNPTGPLEIRYQPPDLKPAMVIERSFALDGWFKAFALDTMPFDLAMGNEILISNFTLGSFAPANNKSARVHIPNHYQTHSGGQRRSEIAVLGFFGAGVPAGNKVCYTQSTFTYTNVFQTDTTTPLQMSLGSASTTDIKLEVSGASSCTTPDLSNAFGSVFVINPETFNNWGSAEAFAGFKGVFTFPTDTTNGSAPVQVSYNSGAQTFTPSFSIIPSLSTQVEGINLYYRALNSPRDYERSEDSCLSIANGGFGFKPIGSIAIVPGTSAYAPVKTAPTDMTANSVLALCPTKGGKVIGGGMVNGYFSGSTPGGGGGTPTAFEITKNASPINLVTTMSCFDVTINLKDSSNMQTNAPAAFNYTITTSSGAQIYSNFNDCQSSISAIGSGSNISFPSGSSYQSYYIKAPSSATNFTIDVASVGLTGFQLPLNAISSGSYYVKLEMPEGILPAVCYSAKVIYVDAWGYPNNVGADLAVSLGTTNGLQFYSDNACTTSTVTTTIVAGSSLQTIYAKQASGSMGYSTATFSGAGLVNSNYRKWTGSGTTTVTKLSVMGSNQTPRDTCSGPYQWETKNANDVPVPSGSSRTLSVVSDLPASFYADSGCSSQLSSSNLINISPSDYSGKFWVKFNSAGLANLSVQAAGLTAGSTSIGVSGAYRFDLQPGTGSVSHGDCVMLTVNAIDYPSLNPTSIPYSPEVVLTLANFPVGSLFLNKTGNACHDPLIGGQIIKPAFSSTSPVIYFQALNSTNGTFDTVSGNYRITSPTYANGSALSVSISAPPALGQIDGASGIASTDYGFSIIEIIDRLSGVAPYTTEFYNGSTWVASPGVSISGAPTNVRVTDANSVSHTYSVTGQSASYVADFTTGTMPGAFSYIGTGGYTVNNVGALAWIGAGTERWDRNPEPGSGFPIRGMLIEGPMTNMLAGAGTAVSENFGLWTINAGANVVINNNQVTTDLFGGSTSQWYVNDSNGGNGFNVENTTLQFTSDMPDNTDFVGSIWMKQSTSRYAAIMLNSNSSGGSGGVVIDLQTGATKAMTGHHTPQYVSGHGSIKHINGWYRVWVRFSALAGTQGTFWIFPAFCSTPAAVHCTTGEYSATGEVYVWGAQVEQGSVLSSYFPTSNASGNRGESALQISTASIAGFSNSQGTLRIDNLKMGSTLNKTLLHIGSSSDNYSLKGLSSGNGVLSFSGATTGSPHASATTSFAPPKGGESKIMFSYNSAVGKKLSLNGQGYSISGSHSAPAISGNLRIGGDPAVPSSHTNMVIKRFEFWPSSHDIPGLNSATKP